MVALMLLAKYFLSHARREGLIAMRTFVILR